MSQCKGKVIAIGEIKTGESKRGKWASQQWVVEEVEQQFPERWYWKHLEKITSTSLTFKLEKLLPSNIQLVLLRKTATIILLTAHGKLSKNNRINIHRIIFAHGQCG